MNELTADELLAACAYLEAVWAQDTTAVESLLTRQPSERPMPLLVALLGRDLVQMLMAGAVGLHDDMDDADQQAAEDRMLADPTARVSKVLAETLIAMAPEAGPQQCQVMARSIISYLLAVSTELTHSHVPGLLAALREGALRRPS